MEWMRCCYWTRLANGWIPMDARRKAKPKESLAWPVPSERAPARCQAPGSTPAHAYP